MVAQVEFLGSYLIKIWTYLYDQIFFHVKPKYI